MSAGDHAEVSDRVGAARVALLHPGAARVCQNAAPHITLGKIPEAKNVESNDLLGQVAPSPVPPLQLSAHSRGRGKGGSGQVSTAKCLLGFLKRVAKLPARHFHGIEHLSVDIARLCTTVCRQWWR